MNSLERLGKPGGALIFSYLVTTRAGPELIVYARSMADAIKDYTFQLGREPWQIRQMSDNE